jgi:hypothetical protein
MIRVAAKLGRSLGALSVLSMLVVAGCATEMEEDETGSGEDALSQAECTKVVNKAVAASEKRCTDIDKQADKKLADRRALETAVTGALGSFVSEIQGYDGRGREAVDSAVRECSSLDCTGTLKGGELKAECGAEKSLLQGACYVRHVPAIRAAATSLDFSQEVTRLTSAVDNMREDWVPLATQEGWLRTQHAACDSYAGSAVQRTKINSQCRASCSEVDPTNPLATGQGSACTPPGYEDVVDDLGQTVELGKMTRPILNVGTVCECRPSGKEIDQFEALGVSGSRGRSCGAGKTTKLVWNAARRIASLECR